MTTGHLFGGTWTEEKLAQVERYLKAYLKALKDKPFKLMYIDAFAGTGSRALKQTTSLSLNLFAEDDDAIEFSAGSVRRALEIEDPKPFDKYIFIESNPERFEELRGLEKEFPERKIEFHKQDANIWIQKNFREKWKGHRAVMFLDPYKMEVEWKTIESIAKTEAIDLWLLFPLGSSVNRLLPRDGEINEGWRAILNRLFGSEDWYNYFYNISKETNLFGITEEKKVKKDISVIADYLVSRLKTIFPGVSEKPRFLYNSKNNPIFLLCFACANEAGADIAVRIADHILKMNHP